MSLQADKWVEKLGTPNTETSNRWIKKLGAPNNKINSNDIFIILDDIKKDNKILDNIIATEYAIANILNERNISDDINEAYEKFATSISKKQSLHERYLHHLENGEINDAGINESVEGFFNSIKGKLGEIRLIEDNIDELQNQFPNVHSFKMHPDPTHEAVDVYGYDESGNILVKIQAKIGDEKYEKIIVEELSKDSERYFAIADESVQNIENNYPEYADKIINNLKLSNVELKNEVSDGLETLQGNYGLDISDNILDVLEIVPEITLVYRIIKEVIDSKKQHNDLKKDQNTKLTVLRVSILLNKFGFVKLGAVIGAKGGSSFGLEWALLGGFGGAVGGKYTAKKIEPKLLDIVLKIMDLDKDDLFYYKNKKSINDFALEFSKDIELLNYSTS